MHLTLRHGVKRELCSNRRNRRRQQVYILYVMWMCVYVMWMCVYAIWMCVYVIWMCVYPRSEMQILS
jgi:hypothetical protein